MFARAIEIATTFTNPYVGLRKRSDGNLYSTMGAFIIVNKQGWALTAAHILDEILSCEAAAQDACGPDEPRVTAHTEIWALPGFAAHHPHLAEARINAVADLALCRLEGVDPDAIGPGPVFRDTSKRVIDQGASVCRLGFPFYDVAVAYDDTLDRFDLDEHAFPVPRFALDGMVARFNRRMGEDGKSSAMFIETSTPGLRGQSGGPLIDTAGRVCGIQSHTTHIDLGFDARYASAEGVVIERQFLNVGAATHVDEARAMMDDAGVRYRVG
jgi:hypothetical protein